jgi:hypothetical protein
MEVVETLDLRIEAIRVWRDSSAWRISRADTGGLDHADNLLALSRSKKHSA